MSESLFNKVVDLSLERYSEEKALAQMISCEFCYVFKNVFFTEHLWTTSSAVNIKVRPIPLQELHI